jgi:subtilisin family serine protease
MKAIISFLLSVMLYISSFAQFGIQESLFLEQLKEQELVSIIVKGDIEKIKETCISMNVNLKYAYQDLAAIQIEKEKLGAFYESMGQGKIEIPLGKAATLMDTALIHNNISQVHNGLSPLLQAYTGKGVVVGILDSGIYFEHDDFKNADGTTRIRYIWDQNENTPSNPPAPYNFGQEWTWQDINNGACNHVEPANQYGHGTTVAGAACGNGLATGTNTGVAPDCDIIAVAVDYYDNNFLSNTVDAVDYVFKKADALGKPCVINTSYGSYYGSHDAKDFASQLIDALIEERAGRVLVASCGNGIILIIPIAALKKLT